MQKPDLDLIVDTFFPRQGSTFDEYIAQLRRDLIPQIRQLENAEKIIWYSFLVHGYTNLGHNVSASGQMYVHLRMGLPAGANVEEFIQELPPHFQDPQRIPQQKMSGVEKAILKDQEWEYAWKALGETSEWVIGFIEAHEIGVSIPEQHIRQYKHFIENSLLGCTTICKES